MKRARKMYPWRIVLVVVVTIVVVGFFSQSSWAKEKSHAQSVWRVTSSKTISSRDIYNNRISVVCGRRGITVYVATVNSYAYSGNGINMKLGANRDRHFSFYGNANSSTSYSVSLRYGLQSTNVLIDDMRNRYDLNVFLSGSRGNGVVIFALDGFADAFRRACGR